MNINRSILVHNCFITSIAHAIMVNVFPLIAYEQSWDKYTFSKHHNEGSRTSITFESGYCVVATRNEQYCNLLGESELQKILKSFPPTVRDTAIKDTLQYLLDEDSSGTIVPSVTSIFWCDEFLYHYSQYGKHQLSQDLLLLSDIIQSHNDLLDDCIDSYEMDKNAISLLKDLLKEKNYDFSKKVFLSDSQKKIFPGGNICQECEESLREIEIYI